MNQMKIYEKLAKNINFHGNSLGVSTPITHINQNGKIS
jgi:hypothetical protein